MSGAPESSRPEFSRPEFSRIVRLDEIGRMQWPAHVAADEGERAGLARRFGFASLDQLEADYTLSRDGDTLTATGEISADLSQPCVATGEPVAETVHEGFTIRFVPEDRLDTHHADEEIEIHADECDVLPYADSRIDIGEAIAETLALTVNPYPRSESADSWLREAGVLTEDQAGPFAALAALKGKKA